MADQEKWELSREEIDERLRKLKQKEVSGFSVPVVLQNSLINKNTDRILSRKMVKKDAL